MSATYKTWGLATEFQTCLTICSYIFVCFVFKSDTDTVHARRVGGGGGGGPFAFDSQIQPKFSITTH